MFLLTSIWLAHSGVAGAETPPAASFPIDEAPARPAGTKAPRPPAAQAEPDTSADVGEPTPPASSSETTSKGPKDGALGEAPFVSEAEPAPIQKFAPARVIPPIACKEDNDAVFRAFDRFAETQKNTRIAGVVSGVVVGAFTIGAGAAFADYFDVPAEPFYILGGIATVLPLLGLVTTSSAENYAARVRAEVPGHSAQEALAMRQAWASFADKARTQRYVESGLGIAVGIASFAFGLAILDGAFSMTESDRGFIGTLLMSLGGAAAAGSVTGFFIKSPMESSYEQFEATRSVEAPKFSVSAGPSHAQLSVKLAF